MGHYFLDKRYITGIPLWYINGILLWYINGILLWYINGDINDIPTSMVLMVYLYDNNGMPL